MNTTSMASLITGTLTTYGTALVVILSAVIGIGVAYLVFRFGWRKVKGSAGNVGGGMRRQHMLPGSTARNIKGYYFD